MRSAYVARVVFFVQAEDGIRDLVRSRGLGDVYKRQGQARAHLQAVGLHAVKRAQHAVEAAQNRKVVLRPVSYTHLTLPTSDLV